MNISITACGSCGNLRQREKKDQEQKESPIELVIEKESFFKVFRQ